MMSSNLEASQKLLGGFLEVAWRISVGEEAWQESSLEETWRQRKRLDLGKHLERKKRKLERKEKKSNL